MASHVTHNAYGKHGVRISKVRRPRTAPPNKERHEFVEVTADVELQGDFEAAFTQGDNRQVVATDTCKNTLYVLAKDHPLDSIESFGIAVCAHFLGRYDHVAQVEVRLVEQLWDRLGGSDHCFTAAQKMRPTAVVTQHRGADPMVVGGLDRLTIAKTTESGFEDFHRDEFRTLADTSDRVLATEMTASWKYAAAAGFGSARAAIVKAMLKRFTDHYSRSVQETINLMAEAALDACPAVAEITITMPNKHHILANMAPFDRENENEVFVVTDEPFGYITATIARDK
ncbi:Uricase [Posidoniimonas polymericola]|uniref:Uricase n=1 Tax=Posidoniimonas polymericola TaxID=2528002 RepID=A0A5C5YMP4_9BACT|nr:urate oxidase [Posidoniimonas polymericola]TWT76110.1 Uricase [Posidoniimonas polymericola]